MNHPTSTRRAFLGSAATGAAAIALGRPATAAGTSAGNDEFQYEVTRTDDEWRAMLDDEEYKILRKGSTELPKTSALWNETRNGAYACRGCDLPLYDAKWKVELDIGWAFFRQSRPNAVLLGIDGPVPEYGQDVNDLGITMIEVHCRRCGSHQGHIVRVEEDLLHCINGRSLSFAAAEA